VVGNGRNRHRHHLDDVTLISQVAHFVVERPRHELIHHQAGRDDRRDIVHVHQAEPEVGKLLGDTLDEPDADAAQGVAGRRRFETESTAALGQDCDHRAPTRLGEVLVVLLAHAEHLGILLPPRNREGRSVEGQDVPRCAVAAEEHDAVARAEAVVLVGERRGELLLVERPRSGSTRSPRSPHTSAPAASRRRRVPEVTSSSSAGTRIRRSPARSRAARGDCARSRTSARGR
jgi:hypothetical protein